MKTRIYKTLLLCLALVAAFCALFTLYSETGLGIPCGFHSLTGLLCPACGTFRMLASLVRLDFTSAAALNPMMLALLPFLGVIFISYTVRYIKRGTKSFAKWQTVLSVVIIALLVLFGVVRNFV